jgi:phage-related protein
MSLHIAAAFLGSRHDGAGVGLFPAHGGLPVCLEQLGLTAVRSREVGQPHVKHLQDKLWEMRFSGRDGIARALYITAIGRRVIVVHAFVKKTQKTPRAALELAARRAQEIKP